MEKENAGNYRKNIHIGLGVKITLRSDRTGKRAVSGVVKNVLTSANEHSHGILVELETGQIGRVCEILCDGVTAKEEKELLKSEKPNLDALLSDGETDSVEYKSSALWSQFYTKEQIEASQSPEICIFGKHASKVIIAKTISAFLNSKGGHLFIGIKENKETGKHDIIGIESEFPKLRSGDQNQDGYRRMIVDDIIRPYFPSRIFNHFNDYLAIKFHKIGEKLICWLTIGKSDTKVFLKLNKKDYFFVKIDTEVRELSGEDLVDYCDKRFK
jgi:uncharacterized repeat protein (TIGR03833 family)